MPPTDYNTLLQTALTLTPEQRTQLIQALLKSLEQPDPRPLQPSNGDQWFGSLPKRIDSVEFQRSIRSEWDD
ncbi:MAG: hypothetical protein ACFCA4_06155 [Cyanophyceae cyanobacterium]